MRSSAPPDDELRLVIDAGGQAWQVYLVPEGMRWDPEIEMRRVSWLCCRTNSERRYITPVPPGWQRLSDADLLAAIEIAPPDLRDGH